MVSRLNWQLNESVNYRLKQNRAAHSMSGNTPSRLIIIVARRRVQIFAFQMKVSFTLKASVKPTTEVLLHKAVWRWCLLHINNSQVHHGIFPVRSVNKHFFLRGINIIDEEKSKWSPSWANVSQPLVTSSPLKKWQMGQNLSSSSDECTVSSFAWKATSIHHFSIAPISTGFGQEIGYIHPGLVA